MIPGEYVLGDGDIVANAGRRTVELVVANTGDRPIQVGSHFHFFEVNRALRFDRAQAYGMRLNVPAGTKHWFDLCSDRRIRAIRLFLDPSGWTPVYTDSGLDKRYEPLCFGPNYLAPAAPALEPVVKP